MSTKITTKANIIAAAIVAAIMIAPASALATHHSYARHASIAAPATVDWQIPLKPKHAFPRVTGSAQFQSQPGQRELQLEVEHLRSLAGKQVVISVNGAVTGSANVSALGIAQFDRNTERGQTVPTIAHGSTVTVRTSTGALVASGRF